MIIDGKSIAQQIIKRTAIQIVPKKSLCVFSVGENDASTGFIRQKKKIADMLGVDFRVFVFSEKALEEEIKKKIRDVGEDDMCGGVIIQLPLPVHIKKENILNEILCEKDVDILSQKAHKRFLRGQKPFPPAVGVFCEVLSHYQVLQNVSRETNLRFAVVGPGFLIGKPIVDYLRMKNADVIVVDRDNDVSLIKNADVVVLGAGITNLVNQKIIKDGALVIDFGCSFFEKKLCGDLLPPVNEKFFYTPTPGGTGPILVAKLFENFYYLNKLL